MFCALHTVLISRSFVFSFFFFNDTATTEIYTLSLHDALPIFQPILLRPHDTPRATSNWWSTWRDRKSTRLNSSHGYISYAVFCLKKKKKNNIHSTVITNTLLSYYYPTH